METILSVEDSHVDVLHEITERLGTADGFHDVLTRVVEFASGLVKCDSCLIYILEGDDFTFIAAYEGSPRPSAFRTTEGLTMRSFVRASRTA